MMRRTTAFCLSISISLLLTSVLVGCGTESEPERPITVDVPYQGIAPDMNASAPDSGLVMPDMSPVGIDPFDNTPAVVLSNLLYHSYDCYSDESGNAESFLASIAFEQGDKLLVQDREDQVFEGRVSASGTSLTLTVEAILFSESIVQGAYHLGELLDFQTASMTCHITSLDYREDDSSDGFLCPTINHDLEVGFYEFNRIYFSSLQSGSVYRERLLEFTKIPDTQIERRSGIYKQRGDAYYIGFGRQSGDDVIVTVGARQGSDDIVIEGVSSIQKPCEPL